jgi:hypothetical protein
MFKLNYKYQNADNRDYKYINNNISTDLNNFQLKINKIYDQLQLGSCVSNGVATCIDYINSNIMPSRLYIYFNGRLLSKLSSLDDTGLTIRDGCKSVAKYSTCSELEWPYNIEQFTTIPDLNCYKNSYKYSNYKYESVNQDINSIKTTLLNNHPILFGFDIYSNFFDNDVTTTGIVKLPNITNDNLLGAHCCVIIGFNDNTQTFTCVNSWGCN